MSDVCVLHYSNALISTWNTAAMTCLARGSDLCTASQYYAIRTSDPAADLFYNGRAVWSSSFSDNDGENLSFALQSNDNPVPLLQNAFACCGPVTPEPFRSQLTTFNGVSVTYIHEQEDTTFRNAAFICGQRGSDLCSKSQYVNLNDAGRFGSTVRRATNEMSDNDGNLFNGVVGTNSADNPSWAQLFAFACCANPRPVDGSCPNVLTPNGVCYTQLHDVADTNFFNAARACAAAGADVCSKSQMQGLRNGGQFVGPGWTNDGADNDAGGVGGLLGSQPDDPNPSTTLAGYACCM